MELIDCLIKVGFTKHESVLYITLCKKGALSGYEAAKLSGIPRSNAYLALAGLVDKGGAYRIESDVVKYVSVPPEEMTVNLRRQLEEVFKMIEYNTPDQNPMNELYITITGRLHIINKMKNMINESKERIYISMSPVKLELVKQEIESAIQRGLKVVIITDPPYKVDGAIIYHNKKQVIQVRLITDSTYVLTGELNENTNTTCLFSKNRNLVHLIKDSLTNEIELITIQNKRKIV